MDWTKKLPTLSAKEIGNLAENAGKKADTDPKARELLDLILASGRLAAPTENVRLDDAVGKAMEAIIFSRVGKSAALAAVRAGIPALAGVDPLLQAELGNVYGPGNEATSQAGYLVNNMMGQEGYIEDGSARMPSGCVAKTGKIFRLRTAGDPKR